MKFNKPYKALLWEEVLVGGSISSIVMIGTFFALFFGGYTPDIYYAGGPRFITYLSLSTQDIEYTSLFLVSLFSLLLILNIGNTGEMLVGFPTRILRYPIPTRLPVTITLYSRLFFVLVFALVLRILLAGMFWSEAINDSFISAVLKYFSKLESQFLPVSELLLIHGAIYLVLQVKAWLFGWSLIHLFTVLLFVVMVISWGVVIYTFNEFFRILSRYIDFASSIDSFVSFIDNFVVFVIHKNSIPTLILLSIFALWLGIKIVNASRHRSGEIAFETLFYLFSKSPQDKKHFASKAFSGFSSKYLAQVWYELKKTGFVIPLWTLILWVFGFILMFFLYNIHFFVDYRYSFRFIPSFFIDNFGMGVFLVLPYISFWVGCAVWALINTRRFFRAMKAEKFDFYWYPILKMERFNVYWLVLWINLLLGVLFIWLVQMVFVYFMYFDFWRPEYSEAIKNVFPNVIIKLKVYSFVTLVSIITGLAILNVLIVWVLLSNPRTITFMIILPLFLFSLLGFVLLSFAWLNYVFSMMTGYKGIGEWVNNRGHPVIEKFEEWGNTLAEKWNNFTEFVLENYPDLYLGIDRFLYRLSLPISKFSPEHYFIYLTICFFFTGFYLLSLGLVIYNRLVRFRDAVFLFLIYVFTFVCLFPWRTFSYLHPGLGVATYLLLSSVMNLFWVRTYLYIGGIKLFKKVSLPCNIVNLREGNSTKYMFLAHLFALGCVAFVPLLRMNNYVGERLYKDVLTSRSLPVTLDEMNKVYGDIPYDENIANKLLEIYKGYEESFYIRDERGDWFLEFCKSNLNLSPNECKELYRFFPPEIGAPLVPSYKPLSEISWKIISTYHSIDVKQFAEELKNLDVSQFRGARYPIDLRAGINTTLNHLSRIRTLAKILMIDALVNFVNEDYTEVVKAFKAFTVLIDSVKDEPLIISQLVRNSIIRMALDCFVWCVNHREIPEPILEELCKVVVHIRNSMQDLNYELINASELLSLLDIVNSPIFYWGNLFSILERYGVKGLLNIEKYMGILSEIEIEKTWIPLIDVVNLRSSEIVTSLTLFALLMDYQERALRYGNVCSASIEKLENFIDYTSRYYSSLFVSPFVSSNSVGSYRWIHSILLTKVLSDMALYIAEIDLFVRQNDRLPEGLEEISSDYVPYIPVDPYDKSMGKIKYRKLKDGSCVIYSVFKDNLDNRGDVWEVEDYSNRPTDYGWKLLSLDTRRNYLISPQYIPPLLEKLRQKKNNENN